MNASEKASSLIGLWRRLPVVVRAIIIGMVILNLGQAPAFLVLWTNLKIAPQVPLFLPVAALWLWIFWRYVGGAWWPVGTSAQRRLELRAAPLPDSLWGWSLIAGGLGMACVMSMALLTGQVADLPGQALAAPLDLSSYPWWTTLAFFLALASTAGVVEEAAFRGYMLSLIQRRHGWPIAILLVAAVFWVAHLSHAYATIAFLPFFAVYSALHGFLVYLTRSIRPSVVLHALGDLAILPIQYGVVPLPFGSGYTPYLICVALFGIAAAIAFSKLANLTRAQRSSVA
jgi:membrane protease YdiL (CAAX protease family)